MSRATQQARAVVIRALKQAGYRIEKSADGSQAITVRLAKQDIIVFPAPLRVALA